MVVQLKQKENTMIGITLTRYIYTTPWGEFNDIDAAVAASPHAMTARRIILMCEHAVDGKIITKRCIQYTAKGSILCGRSDLIGQSYSVLGLSRKINRG